MIKKLVAGCLAAMLLVAPLGCTKSQFVDITDKIGNAVGTINKVYYVVKVDAERALKLNLPDAEKIQGYLKYLENLRDTATGFYDVDTAEAAVMVALQMYVQVKEIVDATKGEPK